MLNTFLRPNSALRHRLRLLSTTANLAVTPRLRKHFSRAKDSAPLRDYLRDVYIPSWYEGVDLELFHASAEGHSTLRMHLSERLQLDRYQFVPWIDHILPLNGTRILEIGCGTGSATLSLAEQGATMTALDLHTEALGATALRCQLHGFEATCINGNAQELENLFQPGQFDMIIFFAVLEHMTLAERQSSLEAAWALLTPGQYLCITDTPNRLWPYDSHTSYLPFFHWLPDELAFAYSRNSPRFPFNTRFREPSEAATLNFIRHGRGVSYHELELALKKVEIVSDQTAYLSARNPVKFLKRVLARDGRREKMLNDYAPALPRALFRENLNLVVRR
jgi:2-polyprenyl-3-methyl-5-hydroxy-6-metoxy-1,4-benzoquinol methylase